MWKFHHQPPVPVVVQMHPKLNRYTTLHSCAVLGRSVVSDSLRPHGLQPTRLLCPWGFSRQEYSSGLPCPSPRDLPNPGLEPRSLIRQLDSFLSELRRKTTQHSWHKLNGGQLPPLKPAWHDGTWKLKFLFSFLPWHLTFWTIIAGFSYLCSLPEQELTTRQTKYYLYLYS